MNQTCKVFVYGTLMSGQANHHLIETQNFIGDARIEGFAMFDVSSYPGIIPQKEESVIGELYEVNQNVLKRLDRLEGEGYLYKRTQTNAFVDGHPHEAFVYVWLNNINGCNKVVLEDMPWKPVRMRCV